MSSEAHPNPDAGSSSDQYVTGREETGDFITDKEPEADTPADGSSNAGINQTQANRAVPTVEEKGRA